MDSEACHFPCGRIVNTTLIYNPYLATLGGGERFIYALAKYVRSTGARVTIGAPIIPERSLLAQFEFDLSFELVQVGPAEITEYSRNFDRLIYLTNELPQPSGAKQSYLVVQFPFELLPPRQQIRLRYRRSEPLRGYRCIVYSAYVKKWLRRRWGRSSRILPPLVQMGSYEPAVKESLILGVSRFFRGFHNKRQDVLIDAFKRLPDAVRASWRLCLAGGCKDDAESRTHVEELRAKAAGYDISFQVNASQATLNELYGKARLFWHATGYGRGEDAPEKAEHFGITTIEAMSFGCVPLAYNDGGQTEIVRKDFGRLWSTLDELVGMTTKLASDSVLQERLAHAGVHAAQGYGEDSFMANCRSVLGG